MEGIRVNEGGGPEYGRLIKEARTRRAMGQDALARKMLVSSRTIRRWESGSTPPSVKNSERLAEHLGIRLETLLEAIGAGPAGAPSEGLGEEEPEELGEEEPEEPGEEEPEVSADDVEPGPPPRASANRLRSRIAFGGVFLSVLLAAIYFVSANGVLRPPEGHDQPTTTPSVADSPSPSIPIPPVAPPPPVATAVLGRDIKPDDEKPCGLSTISAGGSWVFGSVEVDGTPYDAAYRCSMLGGASGELDFSLGKKYSRLHVVVGYASGSEATRHSVEFGFVKDGRDYIVRPFELKYGETRTLDLNVQDVTQLSIRLAETSVPGGNEAPATPVVAALQLY